MTRALMLGLVLLAAAACEQLPTGPSDLPRTAAGVPDVAGTYRGPVTLTIPRAPGYSPMRDTGQMTVTVTQAGTTVTLTATVTWPWSGGPETIWRDAVGTLDAIGTWTAPRGESHTDPTCGRVDYRSRHVRFSLGTLRYDMTADTARCGPYVYSATLTRR